MADGLEGKNALVTGSAQGIGKAIALQLAKQDCHVLVNCCHNPEKAEETVMEIRKMGGKATVWICDITNEKALKDKISDFDVDILVNNARLDPYKCPDGMSAGEWFNALLKVKLIGSYLCITAVAEGMKRRRWGRILNISSVQAHLGMDEKMLTYAACNAGLNSLTRSFAKNLGYWNITVNTLAPGMVITENIHTRLSNEVINRKIQSFPLQRIPSAEEIAEVAVNTIRTGTMTGETVNINSGSFLSA